MVSDVSNYPIIFLSLSLVFRDFNSLLGIPLSLIVFPARDDYSTVHSLQLLCH